MKELVDSLEWQPLTCVWEITRACNLHCGHCGSSAGAPRAGELSTVECLSLIDDLAALGNRHITLSGGEPTLRSDWPRLAQAAVDRGIAVNLVTNGQSDPVRLGREARASGLCNVAVSLDGLQTTHDALRGSGSFERATGTIRALSSAGVWVDVMVTVHRTNLDDLEPLHAVCADLGVRRFRVQLGKPMGNQTHRADLTLVPRHLLELLPLLGRLDRSAGPTVCLGDSVGYFSAEERRLRGASCDQGHWTGCYAGCQSVGIQSDGGVKGCLSLQPRAGETDPFLEGNVREKPLRDIWLGLGAFAYNRSPKHRLDGACASCGHNRLCRGGAKCVAYAYTGRLDHDPMCYLAAARADRSSTSRIWPTSGTAAAAAILAALSTASCGGATSEPYDGSGSGGGAGVLRGGHLEAGSPEQGTGGGGASSGGSAGSGVAGTGGRAAAGGGTSGTGGTTSGAGGTTSGAGGQGAAGKGGALAGGGAGAAGVGGGTAGMAVQDGGPDVRSPADAAADAISCQSVCCMCDYGILPPGVYAACCRP